MQDSFYAILNMDVYVSFLLVLKMAVFVSIFVSIC